MGVLIEHYAGAFPFWLAPVQIKILPVVNNNEKLLEYAKMALEELKNAGIRTILDTSDNTFGKKIRNVKKEKIPYFIIIGEKDMQNGQITLESRNGQSKQLTVKETIQKLEEERKS
jgi:threonyl-tRNA synthetase